MLYKQKILFIHKNKIARDKIASYLREVDFAVILAENIEEAYNTAKTIEPDIILWGATLTADAKKVIRKIRRSRFGKNTPVIAMMSDIELYDRIELENNGIDDVITAEPVFAELRLKIRLHLNFKRKNLLFQREIRRLQNISEIQYNITIANDLNRLCELFDDFLYSDYPFDFILQLVYNHKEGEFDYKNFITKDSEQREKIPSIFEQPVWKEYYFSGKVLNPERITDTKLLDLFQKIGMNSEVFYQMPLYANKKTMGIIVTGSTVKNALTDSEFNDLSVLVSSAGQRIFELRKIYSGPEASEKPKGEIQNAFQRYNEDEIFEYITKEILNKLKTDVSIYFNYNKGFRFLYPQYCYQSGVDVNLFEDDKPPVLMAKDYPSFETFLDSKTKSAVYNLTKNALPDLATMAGLAGGNYNAIVIFTVEIAGEVKGYLITANENSMKRFSNALLEEAEELIKQATDVLSEGRLIKQANQTIKQLDRVFDLGKELTLESHINELLPKIASAIRRTLGWNIVILDKRDVYSDRYSNVCYYGIQEKVYKGIKDKYPNTMYAKLKNRCFRQSNSYFLDHKFAQIEITDNDRRLFEMKIGKQWNDRDWLFIPIQSRGRELGIISVNDPVDRLRPNEDKVRSLEYFANQAAVALENAALYDDLKNSETKYRSLAETITMGLINCDDQGDIIYSNPSFSQLIGYQSPESLLGRNIYDISSDKSRTLLEKYVADLVNINDEEIAKEYESGLEIEVLGNDNKFIPFKIYLTKSSDYELEKGFVGVLADLRPQRRIERLKADFNSMVVHDLRSPLNIIQGYIDIVRNKVVGEISDEQEELLSIAKENCYKVLKLIDNFLIASKLEVGQFQVAPEVNALNTLVESVFENHKVLAEKKNIELQLNIDKKVPLVAFDKVRLEQVLTNYISNALKFTNYGGKIEIGDKLVEKNKDSNGEVPREIHVWVKDDGVGIDYDEQEKVFNKYEQTEAGKDASLKGTGLGLAICKEIISLHRGRVWVESVPKEGSTFYFSLPVTTQK
ncbi:MAG: PAS domain S-box protein [Calditrichaeota bacterium]|nr:PAS domain S-box protein [Calditrichota bacterium]